MLYVEIDYGIIAAMNPIINEQSHSLVQIESFLEDLRKDLNSGQVETLWLGSTLSQLNAENYNEIDGDEIEGYFEYVEEIDDESQMIPLYSDIEFDTLLVKGEIESFSDRELFVTLLASTTSRRSFQELVKKGSNLSTNYRGLDCEDASLIARTHELVIDILKGEDTSPELRKTIFTFYFAPLIVELSKVSSRENESESLKNIKDTQYKWAVNILIQILESNSENTFLFVEHEKPLLQRLMLVSALGLKPKVGFFEYDELAMYDLDIEDTLDIGSLEKNRQNTFWDYLIINAFVVSRIRYTQRNSQSFLRRLSQDQISRIPELNAIYNAIQSKINFLYSDEVLSIISLFKETRQRGLMKELRKLLNENGVISKQGRLMKGLRACLSMRARERLTSVNHLFRE